MTPQRRTLVLIVALGLAVTSCTAGEDDTTSSPSTTPSSQAAEATGGDDQADGDDQAGGTDQAGDGTRGITLLPGAQPDVDPMTLDVAADWIDAESGLSDMLRSEIFLSDVTRTRDVAHLRFVQQHDGVSVRGAQFVVHVRESGPAPEVLGASQSLTSTLPGGDTAEELTAEEATDIAEGAVPGTVRGPSDVVATWLEDGDQLRLGWEVRIPTDDPPSNYAVVVDATTGAVLSVDRLATDSGRATRSAVGTTRRAEVAQVAEVAKVGEVAQVAEVAQAPGCDAPAPPSACIFVVDPIYASRSPSLDPSRANDTLVGVALPNLLDPTSPDLIGRYAEIAPEVAPAFRDTDGVWGQGGRGGQDPTFEAGMTYYWIDYTQQVVQEMGFDFHADDPVQFVPIEPAFADNAFYLFTEDRIHMGAGADGVNEAEDAQGIIHEYGHALLQAAVPDILTEEGGAFHESFADLVSVFTTLEFRNGDVGCLFHWAERGECLRRVDTDLVYPDDLRFEVHLDGELFNGAVWNVFTEVLQQRTGLSPEDCQDRATNPCDAVRDDVYATLLGSLPFLTPTLTLDDAATAFAVSDQTFFAGANADVIQQVFASHGLAAAGTPAVQIRGLMDLERSPSVVAVKILHSYRGDLELRLAVRDAVGVDLCGAVLVSPDPEDDADNVTGRFDLVGTECAAFLPPGPDQRWALTVVDTATQDQGTVFQFSVSHDGQRFLAPGLPQPIPDADATGLTAVIGAP